MLIPEHKYIVESCSGLLQTRDQKHSYKQIILRKPAPRDEFNDPIPGIEDDVFECTVWNQKANEIPFIVAGDKVEAQLIFNGKTGISKQDGKTWFAVQVGIRQLKKI